MAPEVMMKSDHGIACDLFAVGVIAHECLLGKRPYTGSSKLEIREQMLNKQINLTDNDKPEGVSSEAIDIINQLLQRKPSQRLGSDSPGTAKLHKWFTGFDWSGLHKGTLRSPFEGIPLEENTAYMKANKHKITDEEIDEKIILLNDDVFQKCFNDYEYDMRRSPQTSRSTVSSKTSSEMNVSSYVLA